MKDRQSLIRHSVRYKSKMTEEDFDATYRVHAKGPFFLTQTLLPLIANGGRIVNISSGLT
ncbi:SDR family NAD(P)-dependent oxidoreductase, partial [Acetobacter senegalensis]|nr:SDR family NAD(P)-dependent oxidoreductase [Acetobacter senegalensis]